MEGKVLEYVYSNNPIYHHTKETSDMRLVNWCHQVEQLAKQPHGDHTFQPFVGVTRRSWGSLPYSPGARVISEDSKE